MEQILEKLKLISENPGYYKGLTPEEQAELFLVLLTPKKKVFKKPVVITGIDGKTPQKDKDYLGKEAALKILEDIRREALTQIKNGADGRDGKDAVISDDLVERIVVEAAGRITLPEVTTIIEQEPWAIRDALELLRDENRLDKSAIRGLEDYDELRKLANQPKVIQGGTIGKNQVFAFIREAVSDGTIPTGSGDTFETVSKNLDATNATLNYTGANLTSIEYASGVVKTLNYAGDNLTTVVLSGSTPDGISLTKTLSYTGDNLTGVSYS
jgi:hypothetical protein